MTFNSYQTITAKHYGGGDFDYVTSMDEVAECSDTLFLFLMRELAESEGCDSWEEVIRRMNMAVSDINHVLDQLEEACSHVAS